MITGDPEDETRVAISPEERYAGCLLGLAAGDAVGTTLEFRRPGSFTPIDDMQGGGPFSLEPGQWTDDTSMALCLAESLLERDGHDPRDQMERYCRWQSDGYLSSNGVCFDIGNTVSRALARYRRTGEPNAGDPSPRAAGNGSIMRLAPVPMFFHPDLDEIEVRAADSSRTTHGAEECLDACRLMGRMIGRALAGADRDEILVADAARFRGRGRIEPIAAGEYRGADARDVRGTGYVVDSLNAALWCLDRAATFEDAVLAAANLGDDADTTAAVCGQLAGAFFGERAIPARWRARLARSAEIVDLADRLFERAARGDGASGD